MAAGKNSKERLKQVYPLVTLFVQFVRRRCNCKNGTTNERYLNKLEIDPQYLLCKRYPVVVVVQENDLSYLLDVFNTSLGRYN